MRVGTPRGLITKDFCRSPYPGADEMDKPFLSTRRMESRPGLTTLRNTLSAARTSEIP